MLSHVNNNNSSVVTYFPLLQLPNDVLRDIILKMLDPASGFAAKLVCKRINKLIPHINVFDFCELAARISSIALLQWGRQLKAQWGRTVLVAAETGNMDVMKFALANSATTFYGLEGLSAARKCHLDTLKLLKSHGSHMDHTTCSTAAGKGQLNILQWLRSENIPWNYETCSSAAAYGHFNIVQWAFENGAVMDESTCEAAALNGHFEILQFAHQHGAGWGKTCSGAMRSGHLDILEWAIANGATFKPKDFEQAAYYGHLHILQWGRANGHPMDLNKIEFQAKLNKQSEVLKWL